MLAFVINRACDTHRRELFEKAFTEVGIPIERIEAVDGYAVPERLNGYYDGRLSAGQTGCSASHLVGAQRLLDTDEPFQLVLEDDARPTTLDLRGALSEIIAALPDRWDIVRLVRTTRKAKYIVRRLPSGRRIVRYLHIPFGTAAYLLSRSGAEKLLKPRLIKFTIDGEMRRAWNLDLDIFGVTPPLFEEVDREILPSTIQAQTVRRRSQGGPSGRKGSQERLKRIAFNYRKLGLLAYLRALVFRM